MIDGGLRKLFSTNLPQAHWQPIETGMTGRGIPDTNYCYKGVEGWVECKRCMGWTAGLRPEQVGWIARRTRAGGRCFVAVRRVHPDRARALDELWLVRGSGVLVLHKEGLRGALAQGAVCGTWIGGPRRWAWMEIGAWLWGPGAR